MCYMYTVSVCVLVEQSRDVVFASSREGLRSTIKSFE